MADDSTPTPGRNEFSADEERAMRQSRKQSQAKPTPDELANLMLDPRMHGADTPEKLPPYDE
jgi:hypothetical protein